MGTKPISTALIKNHPQLTEKALIDFVNSIEVIDDHIRVRETINQNFGNRLWNDLTGQSQLRQQTVDQHVSGSLNTIANWLKFLQHTQIESDLANTLVAEKVAETRAGVMRLNAKHNELTKHVNSLLAEFQGFDNKFTQKLAQVDQGRLATQHLEAVFDKWQAGRLNQYPVMILLYFVFDELYWGDFGNYCRKCDLEQEIIRLIQQAKDKAAIQLKNDLKIDETSVWAWHEQLADEIQQLTSDQQQVLAYLTDDATADTMPMLWAVNHLSTGKNELESFKNVPIVLNVHNAVQRFANDFEVRNAQQRF
ncbi:MAG: diguanylate cyclase regulator RdcB family protein [Methylococcales bacterium]|nr:diguanylate cyclase regulator RdcB family protein [Methylococcales bacterium]